jgi:AraC-like DNA-binding protein
MHPSESTFHLFAPPYRDLTLIHDRRMPSSELGSMGGLALVWHLGTSPAREELAFAQGRPPGVALIIILPPADEIGPPDAVLRAVELCRPHSILPYHGKPNVLDLRSVLSRPPDDLPGEVTDYLAWRGLVIDLETRRLVRKTVELSAELSTVNGLARALYISRRALGRRFTSRGLPVPSHWLHFGRVLRAAMRLQDSDDTLSAAATRLGYPDGFALSNQMFRLIGVRPVVAREHLGWEWLLEEWLMREAVAGGVAREIKSVLLARQGASAGGSLPRRAADPPSTLAPPRRADARARLATGAPRSPGRSPG